MATLHLVFSEAGLTSCLAICQSDDVIVLFGDATYSHATYSHATYNHATYSHVSGAGALMLEQDAMVRGLQSKGTSVDMNEVVALTIKHSPIVSWSD